MLIETEIRSSETLKLFALSSNVLVIELTINSDQNQNRAC